MIATRPDAPVVAMARSPYARLRPISLAAVTLTDAFWAPRQQVNREQTLWQQIQQCEETGRMDNFRVASGRKQGEFQGIYFNDSDIYKLLEAIAFSLATHPDPKLDAQADAWIDDIAAAQQPDGYLNTYFMFDRAKDRYTNLKDMHELYCAGHLIQAAVAHHRATGKTNFLDIAVKLADHLNDVFGPGKREGACGHPELEMALVELARDTDNKSYLHLAHRMVDARGHENSTLWKNNNFDRRYMQDHVPFRDLDEVTGHAVRMLYLSAGATDIVAETGEAALREALDRQWENFTAKRMYVTGGAGARWEGEALGTDYELPNDRAYTETCAAIASVMWNWRLLHLTGDSKYADLMETTLYNAVLPGLSLDGTHYFYQNPLADRGKHRRQEWFGCACCPPNIARLLASLSGYFYSVTNSGDVYAHLYASGTAHLDLLNGASVTLETETNYPWDGKIEIRVTEVKGDPGTLYLRIPWWGEGAQLKENSVTLDEPLAGGYVRASLTRGSVITLTLPFCPARDESHPHVIGNTGRVALRRGPLVYAIEQADNPEADVWDMLLPDDAEIVSEHLPELLGGVTVLRANALALDPDAWQNALYAPHKRLTRDALKPVALTAIPYYAWANREPGPMQVWLPTIS